MHTSCLFDDCVHCCVLYFVGGKTDQSTIFPTNTTMMPDNPDDYFIARCISWTLLSPSIGAFFILSWFYFDTPESLVKILSNNFWKAILFCFKPIIYPLTYFVRYLRAKSNPNSFGKNQRFEECRRLWNIIRRVEMGVENTGQLILQLWLLGPFVKVSSE